jgi:hypothetical protein
MEAVLRRARAVAACTDKFEVRFRPSGVKKFRRKGMEEEGPGSPSTMGEEAAALSFCDDRKMEPTERMRPYSERGTGEGLEASWQEGGGVAACDRDIGEADRWGPHDKIQFKTSNGSNLIWPKHYLPNLKKME